MGLETGITDEGRDISTGEENWLPCETWSGEGDDLPVGLTGMPGIFVWKLVKSVKILDAESDEGIRVIKRSEFIPAQMDIVDVTINANSLKAVMRQHPKGFTFKDKNGASLSRDAWRAKYKTDALHLMAIRELMKGMHLAKK